MTTNKSILITCASWEDRFSQGLHRLLNEREFGQAIILHSEQYAARTIEARAKAFISLRYHRTDTIEGVLYGAPERTWKETLLPKLGQIEEGRSVVVDISTMPRDVIWQTFWFLDFRRCEIRYVYNRPTRYGNWLSRDPDTPRLVYKMSGVSQIGARTALVILAGYDVDRVKHLVEKFEPAVTLLGLQLQSVDPLNEKWMKAQQKAFEDNRAVKQFWLDAYSADCGTEAISAEVAAHASTHNVLMASMGPKMSAVALYQLHRQNDSLGLVYLPARDFNQDYSEGLGESIWGTLTSAAP
jgi:hypothetical protein